MNHRPQLFMAPLKGITDALFRRVYAAHFSGLDGAVAPFINPQSAA
ncbi:MAG: tRNA-dihydrouridine synthase family protein, partial [Desulfofustis sp.]|nr:tRNA-dihydrouridine synthase family protein [Desulfofustis sp.]